ncbi:LOW QUALITY PROTEIN: oxidoreductase, short chain dehydrogenase/reductase family [Bacillus sp. JCM 19045]|nr:LOW QUALITY PROTEIN: oxidoreductase, short chain dehydrogenase/reductase family [Bacillus sp. JCM 19045]
MSKRRVLVTGGANGIGKTIASMYAEAGDQVFVLDKDKIELEAKDGSILFLQSDVRKEEQLKEAFHFIDKTYGPVDILINNAGISEFKPFLETTLVEWNNVIETNLTSVLIASQLAANQMRRTPQPSFIINIASTRAFMSEPNSEAYAASKGGINALTHAMAISLEQENITVNAIAPGWIHTGDQEQLREIDHSQHPSKRVGKPEDIARMCLFLTNPQHTFINGETIIVDGGMTKKMIYEH